MTMIVPIDILMCPHKVRKEVSHARCRLVGLVGPSVQTLVRRFPFFIDFSSAVASSHHQNMRIFYLSQLSPTTRRCTVDEQLCARLLSYLCAVFHFVFVLGGIENNSPYPLVNKRAYTKEKNCIAHVIHIVIINSIVIETLRWYPSWHWFYFSQNDS